MFSTPGVLASSTDERACQGLATCSVRTQSLLQELLKCLLDMVVGFWKTESSENPRWKLHCVGFVASEVTQCVTLTIFCQVFKLPILQRNYRKAGIPGRRLTVPILVMPTLIQHLNFYDQWKCSQLQGYCKSWLYTFFWSNLNGIFIMNWQLAN